ncbi:MAG: Lrp/AsnC family transcriptional regulator [Pseudomonadota bacterium]
MTIELDEIDHRILRVLQKDASVSMDALSESVALSRNACWRRVKLLEEAGVIGQRVAVLDAAKVGLPLQAIVLIRTNDHSAAWSKRFVDAVRAMPEVQGAYRTTGELDYALRVRVRDVADYDRFYQRLIAKVDVADVSASFVMDAIKETTELPI